MITRTYGCLSIHCRHEFDSQEEPCPPCEVCGARTKWIPGLTNHARAMENSATTRVKSVDKIVTNAIKQYNSNIGDQLSGLKISGRTMDVEAKKPAPSTGRTIPWAFSDAGGHRWVADIPTTPDGKLVEGHSWPVSTPGVKERLNTGSLGRDGKFRASDQAQKPWVPDAMRGGRR